MIPVQRQSIAAAATLTVLAMLAFAANSILCRMALQHGAIDAASFSNIRLLSGAIMLIVMLAFKSNSGSLTHSGSWSSALMLFLYVLCFSYAYVDLAAGTGALILFGLVQATMIIAALIAGDRPAVVEVLGWLGASAGLIYLVLPGVEAPSVVGTVLMAIAGIAWGVYSIRGRGESDPLAATASNFARSLVFIPLVLAGTYQSVDLTTNGVVLAVASRRRHVGHWLCHLVCRTETHADHPGGAGPVVSARNCGHWRRIAAERGLVAAIADIGRADSWWNFAGAAN